MVGVLSRLGKVKGAGEIADIRTTAVPGVAKVKLGDDFVALLGEVNRVSYAAGGKWTDGPGRASHLWSE
jgi:hypothetical protein